MAGGRRLHLGLDRARSSAADVADFHHGIDEEAQARSRSAGGPALVCGAKIRPAASRSDMTLRIEAGDSGIGRSRDRLREPTGSPVVR